MSTSKEPNLAAYTNTIKNFLKQVFGKDAEVVALVPHDSGWKATAEVMLDSEYTTQFAKEDVMHIFEVNLNDCGKVISYERIGTRMRGESQEA